MDAEALIDTNILVYTYDKSEKDKHISCRELAKKCWKFEAAYAVSIQNLSEFYVAVTSKIETPIPAEVAEKRIERILTFKNWIKIRPEINAIAEAMKISRIHNMHYWDALLAATMKENGIFKIYTENETDFKRIPWLEVINPVKKI